MSSDSKNVDIDKGGLSRVLQMLTLSSFGLSFLSVFIPLYILKNGYSVNIFNFTTDFKLIPLWFIIQHSSLLLFCFVAVFLSNRYGVVQGLHIRFVLLPIYISLLFLLPGNPLLFFIIPILMGAESAFFWTTLNVLFLRNTEKSNIGGSLGKFFAYPKLFTLFNPLIAAFIVETFGYYALFTLALFLVGIAYLPILYLSSEKTHFIFTFAKAKEIYERNKKFVVPEIIDNLIEDAAVLWTVFVYLRLMSIQEIGIIGTLVAIFSVLFTLTIGKMTDRFNKHKMLKLGAALVTASWILAYFVGNHSVSVWLYYVATVGISLCMKVFLIPYQSLLFNNGRKDGAQFVVMREVPVVAGRIILYTIAFFLSNNLDLLFLVVALCSSYFLFINTKKFES